MLPSTLSVLVCSLERIPDVLFHIPWNELNFKWWTKVVKVLHDCTYIFLFFSIYRTNEKVKTDYFKHDQDWGVKSRTFKSWYDVRLNCMVCWYLIREIFDEGLISGSTIWNFYFPFSLHSNNFFLFRLLAALLHSFLLSYSTRLHSCCNTRHSSFPPFCITGYNPLYYQHGLPL